jgi:N-acetylneuraminic acid mutarotase
MSMVMDAIAQNALGGSAVQRRMGFGRLYVVGGYRYAATDVGGHHGLANKSHLSLVERYDPTTDAWAAVASMSSGRNQLAIAELEGKLYATGGFVDHNCVNTVELFDPATTTWEAVASMKHGRGCHGCGVLGGKLYVLGGYTDVEASATNVSRVLRP